MIIRPWISQDDAYDLRQKLIEATRELARLRGVEEAWHACAAQLNRAEREIEFLTSRLAAARDET